MKKSELIRAIVKAAGITEVEAKKFLEAATNTIQATMKKGERVTLVGFGTFYVGKRAARSGRNPRTGATIKIKAANTPKFKPSTKFLDIISDSLEDGYVSPQSKIESRPAFSRSGISSGVRGTDSTGPKKTK